MTLVLDASATLAWIFERTNPKEAEHADNVLRQLKEQTAIVPALWHVEILNALVVALQRSVLTQSRAHEFLSLLDRLPIATDAAVLPRKEHVLSLAREYKLSAYDATYLDLALRNRASLATFDKKLARARDNAGVAAG